jgi:hypothetical protein
VNLNCSNDKILRRTAHVELTEERRGAYRLLVGKLTGRDRFECLVQDGRIILRQIFKKKLGFGLN